MKHALLLILALCAVSPALAQQPDIINARVTSRAPVPDVARAIAEVTKGQIAPAWIGYAVPALNPESTGRNDGWSERCRLEQQRIDPAADRGRRAPIRLEPAANVMVLVRVQSGEMRRVRSVSADCQVDGGGLPFYWLGDVNGPQSVAFLKTLVNDSAAREQSEGALAAIALHGDAAASNAILEVAKSGGPRLRQRALFWIAQRAEAQATGIITHAIDNDPDLEVKKQAVFALSQLPSSDAVPVLIKLARSHTDPAVRKQAMFWLGQSKDPRALTFFEDVLR